MIAIEVGARGIIRSDTITGPPHPAHVPETLALRVAQQRPCITIDAGIVRYTPAAQTYSAVVAAALRASRAAHPDGSPTGLVIPSWWSSTPHAEVCRWLQHRQLHVLPIGDAVASITAATHAGHELHGTVAVITARSTYVSINLVDMTTPTPRVLPYPSLVHPEGGAHLDRAIAAHLVTGLQAAGHTTHPAHELSEEATHEFLRQCRTLRETLSTASVQSITPQLPGVETSMRVVRSELEELAEPFMDELRDLLSHAIEHTPRPITSVLLNGGLAAMPLLGQRISADHDLEVIVPHHPRTASTTGAAILLHEHLTSNRARARRLWRRTRPASPLHTLAAFTDPPSAHERTWITPEHRAHSDTVTPRERPLTPDEPLLHLVKP